MQSVYVIQGCRSTDVWDDEDPCVPLEVWDEETLAEERVLELSLLDTERTYEYYMPETFTINKKRD